MVIRQYVFYADTLQGVKDGSDVAGVVVDYCYHEKGGKKEGKKALLTKRKRKEKRVFLSFY
jgi:hypothetical protein